MRVGVVHPELKSTGGANAVCLNVIEALQQDHKVDLITSGEPDIEGLNKALGTYSRIDSVIVPDYSGVLNIPSKYSKKHFGIGLERMKKSLLNRYAQSISHNYDAIISTSNEIDINDIQTLQYIHVPQYGGKSIPGVVGNDNQLLPIYNLLCRRMGGMDIEFDESDCLVSNSKWTAKMVEKAYNVDSKVVYPPVVPPKDSKSFEKREDGFICIGRIYPSKNIKKIIKMIKSVRETGYDTHLHIIGPESSTQYNQEIKNRVSKYDWVSLEGKLDRSELNNALISHKYGIHGRQYEHFGIAVAEMAMSGTIPFVPRSGGQTEIVNESNLLTYENPEEAVRNITTVMSNNDLQKDLLSQLNRSSEQFSRENFKKDIRKIVEDIN
ncbi:glycosyltransferase [Natronoarchaeum sp. GCM10025703]|uniref:glycosyltransferase n=1 Tax=unclassified Natronoarchaeum TaxID=2620183 RepID=UPI003620F633